MMGALPEYKVKLADETAWIAVLGSLATLAGLILIRVGVDAEISAVAAGLVGSVGRLIIGALLPTPAA